MPSLAHGKFSESLEQAYILVGLSTNSTQSIFSAQKTELACLQAAIACSVGCWEGYIENALKEFVSKTKLGIRRPWQLIAQFEYIVEKITAELNTPSWDKVRETMLTVAGIDPNPAWTFTPFFQNQQTTKDFFDGIMKVRHSFAHGFSVPHGIPGVVTPGMLDQNYAITALSCIAYMAHKTDKLLEHELIYRHNQPAGW